MVGLPVCLVYLVIKFPIRVIEPAKWNRVHDSSVGYPGTRHGPNTSTYCFHIVLCNCGIRHVTVPIATRILIANVRHIGVSNICVINLVYFKMQV